MSEEEARGLWDKAVALLERNQSFIPKDASLAFVGVMKTSVAGEIMPSNELEKAAA